MAINDISLTSGMRTNLVSLQNTVSLLNRTQERLSTGKSVNSALDNPLNFFTAQALNSRANDLSGLKDSMSNAVQTIQAANNGITAISALIDQAKAIAASAQTTAAGVNYNVESLTIGSGVVSGAVVTIGGYAFTAVSTTVVTTGQFSIGSTTSQTATNLIAAMAAAGTTTSGTNGIGVLSSLSSGSTITLQNGSANLTAGSVAVGTGVTESAFSTPFADRANYFSQYQSILGQIDNLAADSGYQGVNLLAGNNLAVAFGTGATDSLSITGFDASSGATGLNMTQSNSWATNDNITTDVTSMNTAISTLNSQSSSLASGLSVVNTRQTWVTSMVNTLTQGADNLTLADMNEEGANMLMLQTRQALGTTALSLSSQAAQSVLKLFP